MSCEVALTLDAKYNQPDSIKTYSYAPATHWVAIHGAGYHISIYVSTKADAIALAEILGMLTSRKPTYHEVKHEQPAA